MLYESTNAVIGFVKPVIDSDSPLHQFLTPADRLRLAPHGTYANQIAVAANLAFAMVTIHQAKIIGDLKGQNVLVLPS